MKTARPNTRTVGLHVRDVGDEDELLGDPCTGPHVVTVGLTLHTKAEVTYWSVSHANVEVDGR